MAVYSLFEQNICAYNSCTNLGFRRMDKYTSGYEKATELLLNEVIKNRIGLDSLIMPIMFNYRHYLELSFKNLFWLCRKINEDKIDSEGLKKFEKYNNNNHNLSSLWQVTLDKLRTIDNNIPKTLINQIHKTVEEFSLLDKSGQEFRYPENKNWENTLNAQMYINVVSVGENFLETRERISQLSIWLESLNESKCENITK